jgi:opacity protein-like surface antigen/outer membrane protein OmpA-like peptidoglycan-associated protein
MKAKQFLITVLLGLLVLTQSSIAQEKFEIGPYGGGSFFSPGQFTTTTPNPNTPVGVRFVDGGVFGVRIRENLAEHFGLEQSFTFFGNNPAQFPGALLGTRLRQFYFNGNLIGYDHESRIRPYFSGGIGVSNFRPTDEAKTSASNNLGVAVSSDTLFHFNFGGGLKIKLADHFALDFSVRDFVAKTPTYGYPGTSDIRWQHNMQLQGGFMLLFGGQPPIVHTFSAGPAIEASQTSLCPGESTTLRISASDSIPQNRLTYRWTVKGQEVQGAAGPEYQFTAPSTAGDYDVAVRVFYDTAGLDKHQLKAVKKNPGSPADRKVTIVVKQYNPPQASVSANPSSVRRGERVRLTSNVSGSECSGTLSYRWSVNQGRIISGENQPSAELDTSGIPFSETQQGRQEKKILATLNVTDEKGGKASPSAEVTVSYQAPPPAPPPTPKAIQLSDINYGQNSSRVNNCAKRILANELYSQMTDARYRDYDIVLVGHNDPSEKTTVAGKKKTSLDRERVLNTAAFLSGKGDTCKDIELSRIKGSWVGTQQSDEFKPTFCDTSTQEKKSDAVSSADEKAKNRRVEIWLVPKGADLPAGAGSVEEVPRDEVIKKGCPK